MVDCEPVPGKGLLLRSANVYWGAVDQEARIKDPGLLAQVRKTRQMAAEVLTVVTLVEAMNFKSLGTSGRMKEFVLDLAKERAKIK